MLRIRNIYNIWGSEQDNWNYKIKKLFKAITPDNFIEIQEVLNIYGLKEHYVVGKINIKQTPPWCIELKFLEFED